ELLKLQDANYFFPNEVSVKDLDAPELDGMLNGFQAEYDTTSNDLDADDEETYSEHRMALEMYGFLLAWLISNAENKADSKKVLGNLIIDLANQDDQALNYVSQINGFFDALEERFLDANGFCRSKLLQVYLKILEQKLTDLVIRSLEDKGSIVRKNAIKLLTKLIATHPYGVIHGGELSVKEWEERLEKIENQLKAIQPPQEFTEVGAESSASLLGEDDSQSEDMDVDMPDLLNHQNAPAQNTSSTSADEIMRLQLTRRYYADAVRFIHQIHTAIPTLCQLLGSTTKSEVLEAMEFFVTVHTYKMEFAIEGIKRMLHLIWIKDNNDEGKGIRKRLIESYYKLYIETDVALSDKEAVNMKYGTITILAIGIYVHFIISSLTYNATLAELTSLEQLMSTMMAEELITQRRGAIIILGMFAKAKMEIVQEKTDLLLKIGLGPFGKADLSLAKYTCIALQRLGGNKSRVKEQAINTIYLLGEHPDILCAEIIKHKTASVFDLKIPKADDMDIDGDNFLPDQEQFMTHPLQLKFIEDEWKRRKAEAESKDVNMLLLDTEKSAKNPGDDELEQVAGTTEDEFGEAIAHIREKELLFGENSLLAVFDKLVKKNTLMVLTHLILNGMIKVKGQLGEMAKCLEDEDQRISDLARLFFTELASKDNAVYNNLPDIISNLSSGDNPVNEESYKKIMKFLFDFIEKHTENVVEKLCQRFKNLDDRRQWRNIAYCLSLLPYKSERIVKKLLEGMSLYQDKLHENDVYKAFMDIISKSFIDVRLFTKGSCLSQKLRLLKNQQQWKKQIQVERRQELKKLEETERILSLSSDQEFITPEYRQQKREAGIQNYNHFQSMKRQEGLNHLLSLYHDATNFVTLENLDAKIDEAFANPHPRNVYAHALEDMQIEYQETSGGVNENEILKRLGQIKDTLDGTSHSGVHLGLDMIDPPIEPIEEHEQSEKSNASDSRKDIHMIG
ncbi:18250_t:CDS:10, partial [Racocetra fulgida]